jgi:isopropylmalate/homocitrate/citramalate synthase
MPKVDSESVGFKRKLTSASSNSRGRNVMRANAKEPGHGSDPRMRKERQEAVEAKEQAKVDKEAAAKKEIEDAVQKERTISQAAAEEKETRTG